MSKRKKYLTCAKKYDLPLFCGAWLRPLKNVSASASTGEASSSGGDADGDGDAAVGRVVFGGGGGAGNSGLKNSVLLAEYNSTSDALSEAISDISTDDAAPASLATCSSSNEVVVSVSNNCRVINVVKSEDGMGLEWSESALRPLQDVGEQRCLVFSLDGTKFATGGDDGYLRVFEWPSMELLLDQADAHQSVKDLDFSLDSTLLASTGDSGPCRIWDIKKASAVSSLTPEKGAPLGYCRFSRDATRKALFLTSRKAGMGYVELWECETWKRISSKKLIEVPISAFNISPDGKLLAIGSSEGDVSICDTSKFAIARRLKSAHMVFVTSMEFAPNGRALLSVSGDSSARITAIGDLRRREGCGLYVLMLLLVLLSVWLFWAFKDSDGKKSLADFVQDAVDRVPLLNSYKKRT